MTLKEWIKKVDLVIDVKIWGQDYDIPLFEGLAFDIPWTIVDFQIGRTDSTEEPIYICTYKNENNITLPMIVINVIEKEEGDFSF